MNLYLDCEWNSYLGELISVAVVDEAAGYFYQRLAVFEFINPWVMVNVMPHVAEMPELTKHDFQTKLEEFLMAYPAVHIISDWPEDLKWFCEMLITGPGERINTPPITFEILRDLDTVPSKVPHHALHDAYGLRESYWFNRFQDGREHPCTYPS